MSYWIHYKEWNKISYQFPKFNGATVEVGEWIGNFNPHFPRHVITYPCWDESQSMVVEAPPPPLYCIWLLFQGQGQDSHNPSHNTKYIYPLALLDCETSDK